MERLNPINDYVFKKLFGEKGKEKNLKPFLQAILDSKSSKELDSIEILEEKELSRDFINDKASILDVLAKLKDGSQINIEIQIADQNNMDKRTLFYWSRLYQKGISKGKNYKELKKVITINILDFEFLPLDKYHTSYHLWEDEIRDYMFSDLMEIHFIELPKFRKLKNKDYENNQLHRWLKFLEKQSKNDIEAITKLDSNILETEKDLEYLSLDEKTLALYTAREDALMEERNIYYSGHDKGKIKGQFEMARNLIKMGIPDKKILEAAKELSIDDLNQLKKEIENDDNAVY